MKKNWKNNRGYRWVGVIIFLFPDFVNAYPKTHH